LRADTEEPCGYSGRPTKRRPTQAIMNATGRRLHHGQRSQITSAVSPTSILFPWQSPPPPLLLLLRDALPHITPFKMEAYNMRS